MGGGLESRCVGRVYGADGAVPHGMYFEQKLIEWEFPTCRREMTRGSRKVITDTIRTVIF